MHKGASSAKTAPRRAEPRTALRIGGFVPFSATDYPGALSAVVFCQGCPWRCSYCHNPHLVAASTPGVLPWPAIVGWLGERRDLLDAIVFSGGEPLAQSSLIDAMKTVRSLGFRVGVHTGGAYPRRLAHALPYVDWIGLDVKAPLGHYPDVTGAGGSGIAGFASLERVLQSGVACEVRTTVHALVTPVGALLRLALELGRCGVQRWVLQRFRAPGCADPHLAASREDVLDDALLEKLRLSVPTIEVR
jgi:pyruvate formate lyase activating enzyme